MTLADPYCQRDSKDPALRAHGCTLFTDLYLQRWASDGAKAPTAQAAIDKAVWDLQADSGATMKQFLDRGTTLDEAERAYEHDRVPGHIPFAMRKYHGGSVRKDLIPALEDGNLALVCVRYSVIVDAGQGVGTFPGGHACAVGNPSSGHVDLVDPLRRNVIRLDIDVLETAMERFGARPWSNGRGEFGVVGKSPTWARHYRAKYTASQKKLTATEALLAECVGHPPSPPDVAAARAQGIADAAAAASAVK